MSRLTICILILAFSSIAVGARILCVFPYPSYSHQVMFRSLSMELVKRGHEVVVFTSYPMKDLILTNYTEMDVSILERKWKSQANFMDFGQNGMLTLLDALIEFGSVISDTVLSHPAMKNILAPNTTETFDVILMQELLYDALYALPIQLNVPMIGVNSLQAVFIHDLHFGNELIVPYEYNTMWRGQPKNVWQRLQQMYTLLRAAAKYYKKSLPIQDKVLRKHFGDTMPPIETLSDRFEIVLIGTHPFLQEPKPTVPGMVFVGGCRFMESSKNKTLPQDLKSILDNAKNGFIYFSMGSNVKIKQLPDATRIAMMSAFAEMPQTIIFKSEMDVKDKPENVIIRKWCPQIEILSHPNIKLFIFQGGLQSTEEAIENEVPMVGIPVFADQHFNVHLLKSRGVADDLQMSELTKETFKRAMLKVISDPSYKDNIRKLRDLMHDLPYNPMDNAFWWIEHVIRHKGAKHLRCKSRDMAMYKLLHLDVIAVLLAFCVLLLSLLFFGLWFVCRKTSRFFEQYTGKSLKKD